MNKQIEFKDFKTICRICLYSKDEMIIIFSSSEIMYMIEECTSIQVLINEKLPQNICNTCHSNLKIAYDFKQQCIASSEILYKVLEQEKKEYIKDRNEVLVKNELDLQNSTNHEKYNTHDDIFFENNENKNVKCESYDDHSIDNYATQTESKSTKDDDEDRKSFLGNDIADDPERQSSENERTKEENKARQKSLAELLIKKYKIYNLTCNICRKDLSTRTTLLRHMETHNKNRTLKYKCSSCNKAFYAIENLKKHEIRHYGGARFQCDKCSKCFYVLSALGVHYKNTHKVTPVKCNKCSVDFNHPLQLEQHNQQNHEAKKFVCDVCGKVFTFKYKLRDHQSAHSEERPFPCSICNKKFKHNFALTAHIKLQHIEPERREMCFVCGKLIVPGRLTVHLESHDKTVVHKCHVCNKIYRNKYALRSHVKDRHSKNAITRKYYCKICHKALGSTGSLTNHMTIMHSDVKKHICSICGKSYKLQSHVKVHIQTAHMDVRPHICSTCDKAFHTKTLLKNHMRTHTGERPFSCSVCGKTFGFKNVLNTHMKVHSK